MPPRPLLEVDVDADAISDDGSMPDLEPLTAAVADASDPGGTANADEDSGWSPTQPPPGAFRIDVPLSAGAETRAEFFLVTPSRAVSGENACDAAAAAAAEDRRRGLMREAVAERAFWEEELYVKEYGYPAWPDEMKDPDYFRKELFKMRTDPRYNKNLGRSMDQEFWNDAARLPWAKILMRREQHWSDRKSLWLQQYQTVERCNKGRQEVGELLEDCPSDVKRLVAPIMKYKVVEAVLLSVNDEALETGVPFEELLRRPDVFLELQSARARIDRGGAAEARRMQEDLDALMARARHIAEAERERCERGRSRIAIDMEGLRIALEFGQKCKKDGLLEWLRGDAREALRSWRQGDATLRRFRAPARCINENAMLADLHCSLLRNLSQAAIKLEMWTEALDAADRALELCAEDHRALFRRSCALEGLGRFGESRRCLDQIEDVAVGRKDRERISRDCTRRRSRLGLLERRHQADWRRLLRVGLGSAVFSEGRPLPVQSGKAELALELPKAASQPLPLQTSRPGHERLCGKKLTRDGAMDLLLDLELVYTDPWFVRRVDKLIRDLRFDTRAFAGKLGRVAFEAQRPVLAKWGFEASGDGILEMRSALQDLTGDPGADDAVRERADRVNRAAFGSPGLGMFERSRLGV